MDSHGAAGLRPVFNPCLPAGTRHRLTRESRVNPPRQATPMRQVRYRDQIVGPLALDLSCRQLLLRAQRAISSVVRSQVYTTELHNTPHESVLRQHEWEIAIALRDITELRAEHASTAVARKPGPMTAAVLDSHQRALTLAWEATASRVSALERYAAQLQAADAAQQDWRGRSEGVRSKRQVPRPSCPHCSRRIRHRGDLQPDQTGRSRCSTERGRNPRYCGRLPRPDGRRPKR